MPAGIFGLKKTYKKQVLDAWPELSEFGYFGGGQPSISTIQRLDFSNETVSTPGNDLTQARGGAAGVSNSNYGYFGGGITVSIIDRLDFSSETTSAPGTYQLTEARGYLTAVSNSNYGYFAGGYDSISVCTIDRLDFSNETIAAPGNYQLTQARFTSATVSNSNYGYFGGGGDLNPTPPPTYILYCTIDRLDFSNETIAAPGNYQLTQARAYLTAVSNSNYGYFAGGWPIPHPPTILCTIDPFRFL